MTLTPIILPPPPQHPRSQGPCARRDQRKGRNTAVVAAVAAVAAVVASGTVLVARNGTADKPLAAASTVTVTPTPTVAPAPAPMSVEAADYELCVNGWLPALNADDEANRAVPTLPEGLDTASPEVQRNPVWSAAIRRSGEIYTRAADALATHIPEGATPILKAAATTTVLTFRMRGQAATAFEPTIPIYNAYRSQLTAMGLLCTRLVS